VHRQVLDRPVRGVVDEPGHAQQRHADLGAEQGRHLRLGRHRGDLLDHAAELDPLREQDVVQRPALELRGGEAAAEVGRHPGLGDHQRGAAVVTQARRVDRRFAAAELHLDRHAARRHAGADREHAHARLAAALAQRIEEGDRLERMRGRQRVGHEGAAALPALDQPLGLQVGQRAAHGDPRHAEVPAEVRLVRQRRAGRIDAAHDLLAHHQVQLAVQRRARRPGERRGDGGVGAHRRGGATSSCGPRACPRRHDTRSRCRRIAQPVRGRPAARGGGGGGGPRRGRPAPGRSAPGRPARMPRGVRATVGRVGTPGRAAPR